MTEADNSLACDSFDEFELRIELRGPYQEYAGDLQSYLITQAVYINGENLASDNPIDLVHLCKSCQLNGEFFIVTCGCGDAGSAGIDDGIRVTHLKDSIVWEVPTPLFFRDMTEVVAEAAQTNRKYQKFSFRPAAYLSAVQKGLREAKAMLFTERQPVECSPYGMTPEKLLVLDPVVFSSRGAPLGCALVGKTVEVDRFLNYITINGIFYRNRELPLPADIKALVDWSRWEPKQAGNGYVFGSPAAPDWEVRRRIKEMGKYLASILVVGGVVECTLSKCWDENGASREQKLQLDGYAKKYPWTLG